LIFDDTLLLGFYAIPFLFALVFPGLPSLGIGLAFVTVSALLLAVSGSGGGVGYALGLTFLGFAVMGFVSGAVVRAISFRWAEPSREPLKFFALALIGFAIPPVATAGPSETLKWLSRPNVATCEASTFQVLMGRKILHVPGAPVFSLRDDSDEMPIWFDTGLRSKGFEKFCAEYLLEPKLLNKALSVQPWVLGSSSHKDWVKRHCAGNQTAVDGHICSFRKKSDDAGILDSAVIFDPKVSKAQDQQDAYALDKILNEKLLQFENGQGGDRRLIMVCDADQASVQTCSAAGVLDNGLGYRLRMYTAVTAANRNAWRMRSMLDKLTDELAKPPQ
jgi:hypothetical protein